MVGLTSQMATTFVPNIGMRRRADGAHHLREAFAAIVEDAKTQCLCILTLPQSLHLLVCIHMLDAYLS